MYQNMCFHTQLMQKPDALCLEARRNQVVALVPSLVTIQHIDKTLEPICFTSLKSAMRTPPQRIWVFTWWKPWLSKVDSANKNSIVSSINFAMELRLRRVFGLDWSKDWPQVIRWWLWCIFHRPSNKNTHSHSNSHSSA